MHDTFNEIITTIRHNKLRTALTGFSVAWGIFILIVLLGAGNGLINAVSSNSKKFLANSMVIYGGETSKAYAGMGKGRAVELNDKDMAVTDNGFGENIEDVGAELDQPSQTLVYRGSTTTGVNVSGVYPNDVVINKRTMMVGRFINDLDLRDQRKNIVISSDMAKELLERAPLNLMGQYISAAGIVYQVVGIYESDKSTMGNDAFIPFTTFRTIYSKGDKTGNIVFSFHGLNSMKENEDFENAYRSRVNRLHDAAPDDENSIWIWNRFTQNLQMNTGTTMIRTALWIIGILTLISGIVGVSNIMLITVKERTREFGIRKAIGARPKDILMLIIAESIIITSVFGYIGMLCGILTNLYMDATMGHMVMDSGIFRATMFVDPTVGLDVCIKATLTIIIAGTIAGLIPAIKASRIRPIEALRAE